MRAFQLKITIKKSKPPIWRRVIVPEGITFSQLSTVLNKAMGGVDKRSLRLNSIIRA